MYIKTHALFKFVLYENLIYVLYEKIVSGMLDFIAVVYTFNFCCKQIALRGH